MVSKIENMTLRTCEENCDKCPSNENLEQLVQDDIYKDLAEGAIILSKAT